MKQIRPSLRGIIGQLSLELSPATVEAYHRDLEHAERFFTRFKLSLKGATIEELEGYLRSRGRKDSPATVSRRIASLRVFFRHHQRPDVAARLEAPKADRRLPDTLNPAEVAHLLTTPDASPLGMRNLAMLELLYCCGLRASEVCDLRLNSVNLNERYVRVFGKGSKERIVPMSTTAAHAITRWLAVRVAQGDFLFVSKNGKRLDRADLYMVVYNSGKRAQLRKNVHPHMLRHCFASHLLSGGANVRVVQELLGHSSVETTQIYTHVDTARLKKIHALLGR